MDSALVVTLAAAAAGLLVLAVVCALLVVLAGRRRLQRELAESRQQLDALARRVESMQAAAPRPPVAPEPEYLITTVGEQAADSAPAQLEPVSAQQFASIALGESLVRIFAFGYGVRRALSAENRNRIRFEIRREVRRSRKQRRRDLKEARRTLRAAPTEDAA